MNLAEQVLADFVDAWNAGRRPRVPEYLARVPDGAQRAELAADLQTFLELAPQPALDEATRAAVRADPVFARVMAAQDARAGAWPSLLPALRSRAGLSVREVAERLVARFRLAGPEAAARTERYIGDLEAGRLAPARVSQRLLDALGDTLGTSAALLRDAALPAPQPAALYRTDAGPDAALDPDIDLLSRAAFEPADDELDELDRLFVGGPDG